MPDAYQAWKAATHMHHPTRPRDGNRDAFRAHSDSMLLWSPAAAGVVAGQLVGVGFVARRLLSHVIGGRLPG
jgi:hypothetical protein